MHVPENVKLFMILDGNSIVKLVFLVTFSIKYDGWLAVSLQQEKIIFSISEPNLDQILWKRRDEHC